MAVEFGGQRLSYGESEARANQLDIQEVTLVGPQVRLHVFWRHQSHWVPLLTQGPPQKMRSTAGLHADQLHL